MLASIPGGQDAKHFGQAGVVSVNGNQVSFRLDSEDDRSRLDRLAARSGVRRSALLRSLVYAALENNVEIAQSSMDSATLREVRELRLELSRIGTNLNQIARTLNSGGTVFSSDVMETVRDVSVQVEALSRELGGFRKSRSQRWDEDRRAQAKPEVAS